MMRIHGNLRGWANPTDPPGEVNKGGPFDAFTGGYIVISNNPQEDF